MQSDMLKIVETKLSALYEKAESLQKEKEQLLNKIKQIEIEVHQVVGGYKELSELKKVLSQSAEIKDQSP